MIADANLGCGCFQYCGFTIIRVKYSIVYKYNDSSTVDRSNSLHREADEAADTYIHKNVINLGNTVHADKFSHYALRGRAKTSDISGVTHQDILDGNDSLVNEPDEIFYRVGLYEYVPVYFLPVLLGKDKSPQIVRAGAVAVLVPGTTTVVGGKVTIDPTSSFSIFDNLITYSDTFHTRHTDHNNGDKGSNSTYVYSNQRYFFSDEMIGASTGERQVKASFTTDESGKITSSHVWVTTHSTNNKSSVLDVTVP